MQACHADVFECCENCGDCTYAAKFICRIIKIRSKTSYNLELSSLMTFCSMRGQLCIFNNLHVYKGDQNPCRVW